MFKAISLFVCFALLMSTAGDGISATLVASKAWIEAATQAEPDPYNEAPPSPVPPYQNGRDDNRAGMWDSTSLQHLGQIEETVKDAIASPSGLPPVAPQNVLMQPTLEEGVTTAPVVSDLPASARASVLPQVPMGSSGGGLPFPWESGFPGGGSSGVDTIINSNTGNLNLRVPIMSWKMRGGMEIDFSLYYNSRSNSWSRFGRNWTSSFDAYIFDGPNNSLQVTWGDGTRVIFTQVAPASLVYKSPAGIYETITKSFPSDSTLTLKTKSGMQYEFQKHNSYGGWFLSKIRERIAANEITIHRDALDPFTFTSVTEPVVGPRFSVGGGSRVTTINDFTIGTNRTWTLEYSNSSQTLASIRYPGHDNPTRYFTYDFIEGFPVLATETDLRGKVWRWLFGASGMCHAYWTPTTYKTFFDLNPAYYFNYIGDSCTFVKPGRSDYGNFTRTSERHQYNSGRIAHLYDEAGFYESYTWVVGDLNVYKDKRQAMWSYDYDANGNVTQTTAPTGEIQKYTYTADNDLESTYSDQVSPSVNRFSYTHGRCTNVSRRANPIGLDNPQASATLYTTDSYLGQYNTVTPWGPGGGTAWTLTYSSDERFRQYITALKDPQNNTTAVTTDEWGRILTITPPGQSSTTIAYDSRKRPYKVTHPGGNFVEVTMDGESNVTSLRDELGRYSYWTYDDDGRLLTYHNAKGEIESYVYDDQDFLKTVTNARGYTRSYCRTTATRSTALPTPMGRRNTGATTPPGKSPATPMRLAPSTR